MAPGILRSSLWLLVAAAICAVSQILMRWGGQLATRAPAESVSAWVYSSRWWLCGLGLGWFAGLMWAWALRTTSLAYAFPIYTGLVYVLTLVGGWFALRESLAPVQIAGVLIVLLGVLLIMLPELPGR